MMLHKGIVEILLYSIYVCFVMTLGVMVNKRLYQNIKNEEHQEKGKIIQRILKTFARVQYFGWPPIIILAFTLKANKEVLHVFPTRIVHPCIQVLRAMYTMMNNYVGFNSFIIAITRYCFIVHDSFAEKVGIKRLRPIFLASSIGFPLITSMINESINPVEDVWSSIFEPNYIYSGERNGDNNDTTASLSTLSNINAPSIKPLLHIPDRYIPTLAKYGLKMFWFIMLVSTFSNIMEGILYLRIYVYYFRTEKESFLKTGLSDRDKIMRRRKARVSIQMTVLSWSLEVISGIISFLLIFAVSRDDKLEPFAMFLIALNLCLYFIFVPVSYLVNTEVLKAIVLARGWFNLSKSIIISPFIRRSPQVAAEQNSNQA